MHGMGGQILPRGYLGITPPDVECIHGLGGMDSTMEHACATSRADKTQTGPKSKYLTLLAFQLAKWLGHCIHWCQVPTSRDFPKIGRNLGGKNRIKSQTPWRCKSITQGSDIRVLFDSHERNVTVA